MASGMVAWFNPDKGYGFITPDDGSEDVFVHWSRIRPSAERLLHAGQRVELELVVGPQGREAHDVVVTGEIPDPRDGTAAARSTT